MNYIFIKKVKGQLSPPKAENVNCQLSNVKCSNSGFTLVELLLYVSISAIILLAASVFLGLLMEARVKNQVIAEVEQQGAWVSSLITQAIRNADTINSPSAGTSAASLSINTIVPANNPTIFDLSAGVIRMTEGAGSPIALTNNKVIASGLTFQNLSRPATPGIMRLQFTLTYHASFTWQQYAYQKTFVASAALRQP